MESTLFEFFKQAPYAVSLLAGILTFFSPCVLPLIPAYLSYISGVSVKDLQESEGNALGLVERLRIMRASLLFIAGFSTVFVLLGASMASIIGDIFSFAWVNYLAGGIIVLFGLHMAGALNIRFLNYEKRADFGTLEQKSTGGIRAVLHFFAPFLLGLSFALGWTPCIGPIFAAIISMAATEQAKGVALMSVYAIGLGIPFFLTALLTSRAMNFFKVVKRNFKIVEIVAGGLLVLIGIAVATGGLGKISAFFSKLLG